jgi:serine/threonine-protein kinase
VRTVDRYEIEAEIGRGGMGAVLRGRDPALGRQVAIKLLLGFRNPKKRRRFQTEVQTLAKIRHPNVVGIHASGVQDGVPYLVMDWVPGQSLQERLSTRGPLSSAEAASMTRQLASALAEVHAQGVLHRDLKPSNVLLTEDGTPLLTDFGLAKDLDEMVSGSVASMQGAFLGTPGYLPPEQAQGELSQIGPRSDIYGLGATLYAMLTARPPYEGETTLEVLAAMDRAPRTPSRLQEGIDPGLEAICMRCLRRKPTSRYPDVQALLADLDAFLAGRGSGRRAGPALAGVAVVVAALVGATAWAARGVPPDAPEATPSEAPSTPGVLEQAEALLEAERWDEAAALLDGALAERQERALYLLRSRARRLGGDGHGAEADAAAALRLDQGDPAAWMARALTRADRGDWEGALGDAGRALDLEPSAEHHLLRSRLRAMSGDLEGAITDATAAIHKDPESATAYAERGTHWHALQDAEQAEADYARALQLDREEFGARRNLGVLLVSQERWEEALPLFESLAQEANPKAFDWLQLAVLRAQLGDVERALEAYARAQQLDPTLLAAWLQQGQLLLDTGRFEEALEAYDQAARLAPAQSLVFLKRGVTYTQLGEHEEALRDYERAVRLDPNESDARFNLAETLRQLGRLVEAEARFSDLLRQAPGDAQIHELLYELQRELGRADDALSHLEALQRLRPGDAGPLELQYAYLTELGRRREALTALDRLVELEPGDGRRLLRRAMQRFELGLLVETIEDAQRIQQQHPQLLDDFSSAGDREDADRWAQLGALARAKGNDIDALLRYTWSLQLDDARWEAWADRGNLLVALGDPQAGLADLERALVLAPEEAVVFHGRYVALLALGRTLEARESLERAARLDPAHASVQFALGEELFEEDPAAATAAYERAVAAQPDSLAAWNNLALLYLQQGRHEEAEAAVTRLIDARPDDFEPYLTRGSARRSLGDFDGALEDYRTAQRLNPNEMRCWAGSAQLFRHAQEWQAAIADFSRGIKLDPEAASLYFQRGVCHEELGQLSAAQRDFTALLELIPGQRAVRLTAWPISASSRPRTTATAPWRRPVS